MFVSPPREPPQRIRSLGRGTSRRVRQVRSRGSWWGRSRPQSAGTVVRFVVGDGPAQVEVVEEVCALRPLESRAVSSTWLESRPRERIESDALTLRRWNPADAEELNVAITRSLVHLRQWLTWAAQRTDRLQETAAWIEEAARNWDRGSAFDYGIFDRDAAAILGGVGMSSEFAVGVIEIGYWVHVDCVGRGIATMAARAMVRAAFEMPEVSKVAIRCDAGNVRSASVARKLGFGLSETRTVEPEAPGHTGREMVWLLGNPGAPNR